MGLLPNEKGTKEIVKDRRFIHNIRIATPGRFYYSKPYWWSVFVSGWYDFGNAIPIFKKALIKNQMALRYIVYIKEDFWGKLYADEKITNEADQAVRRETFLQDMNDFLAGEENAGKGFVSHFRYDRVKGFEDKDIIINTLDSFFKGGEYIEDSEEVSNTICYGMNVHPSIIGAAPGKVRVLTVLKPVSCSHRTSLNENVSGSHAHSPLFCQSRKRMAGRYLLFRHQLSAYHA